MHNDTITLTKIQELLDGERRGGELGVVLDLIGDGVFQQVPAQPHDAPQQVGDQPQGMFTMTPSTYYSLLLCPLPYRDVSICKHIYVDGG